MPRRRRTVRPYRLIHIIVRFLNHEYLLDSDEARAEYERRAALCFGRSDWRVLSFVLMGTHTHFGAISGLMPFADISRPLHVGFDQWLKARRKDRLGPTIATRPTTKELPLSAAGRLIAYHHNNPVAAGVVSRAGESDWSSHRFYAGDPAPSWLCVDTGLELAGFAGDREGFCKFVDSVAGATDIDFDDQHFAATRSQVRAELGPAIELGCARQDEQGRAASSLWMPEDGSIRSARTLVSLEQATAHICGAVNVAPQRVRSPSRARPIVRARRLIVLTCRGFLDRSLTEVAAAVGISIPAARKLELSAGDDDRAFASLLAEQLLHG